jgi:hypothetical protein
MTYFTFYTYLNRAKSLLSNKELRRGKRSNADVRPVFKQKSMREVLHVPQELCIYTITLLEHAKLIFGSCTASTPKRRGRRERVPRLFLHGQSPLTWVHTANMSPKMHFITVNREIRGSTLSLLSFIWAILSKRESSKGCTSTPYFHGIMLS